MVRAANRLFLAVSEPEGVRRPLHTDERFVQFHVERLKSNKSSAQTIKNHLSTRAGFAEFLGGEGGRKSFGWEFGSDFKDNLKRYCEYLRGEKGYVKQYVADVRSRLKSWRVSWIRYSKTEGLPEKFSKALKFLLDSNSLSINNVAQECNISFNALSSWVLEKKVPRAKSLQHIRQLEEFFELPPNTLRVRLPKVLRGGRVGNDPSLTPWRDRQREITLARLHDPNYVPVGLKPFPPHVEAELGNLLNFFTDSNWCAVRGLVRNSSWRVREKDGKCVTGEIKRRYVGEFLGFLVSPLDETELKAQAKGERTRKQYGLDELSIALLSDARLVNAFNQRKKRNRVIQSHNAYTKAFLEFTAQLVRPETGFLWQQPEYREKVMGDVSPDEWRAWCTQNHSALTTCAKNFRKDKEYRQTRDSWEPIRAYVFNRQHPLDVLDDAVALMKHDFALFEGTDLEKAMLYSDILMLEFLTHVPLRVWNLSIIEWRSDNTGHLYQLDGKRWWVRFKESEFKTEHTKQTDQPYNIPLPARLGNTIKEYLSVHRPILIKYAWDACKSFREQTGVGVTEAEEKKVANCPYVFRPHPHYLSQLSEAELLTHLPVERVSEKALSARFSVITRNYVERCVGVGPHAARKIFGSEIAKNHRQNYVLGAALLHDRTKTFEESYKIAEPADFAATFNEYRDHRLQEREDERRGIAGRIGGSDEEDEE